MNMHPHYKAILSGLAQEFTRLEMEKLDAESQAHKVTMKAEALHDVLDRVYVWLERLNATMVDDVMLDEWRDRLAGVLEQYADRADR